MAIFIWIIIIVLILYLIMCERNRKRDQHAFGENAIPEAEQNLNAIDPMSRTKGESMKPYSLNEKQKRNAELVRIEDAQRAKNAIQLAVNLYGPISPIMICPHCQNKGSVHTKHVRLKKGISGGKATAALFTAGLTMFVTGLSRKEDYTQAHCGRCGATWKF